MFIKLTDTDGCPVHVRAAAVNVVMDSAGGSLVWLSGDTDALRVAEAPDDVLKAVIEDARKGAHR